MNLSKLLKAGIFCACVIFTIATSTMAQAQTFTWVGAGTGTGNGDDLWSGAANWSGGAVPVGGATTAIQFNTAANSLAYFSTYDLPDSPFVLNSLGFNNTVAPATGLITLSTSNPFQFAGTTPGINMVGAGSATITSGSSGVIFDTTTPFTIGGTGTGSLTIGGLVDNSVFSGAGAVTVNYATKGSATTPNLILGDVGGWTGNLNITSGYVRPNRTTGDLFSNSTILTITAGSTFNFNSHATEAFGGLQGAGAVALGSTAMQFVAPGDRTWAGTISGTGSLNQLGGGVLTLGAANTYTGATTITNGTLRAAAASVLSTGSAITIIPGSGTLDLGGFSQTITGLQGGLLSKDIALGAGTLTISGSGTGVRTYNGLFSGTGKLVIGGTAIQNITGINTYTGTTTVNGGTLRINPAGLQASSAVSVAAAGTLDLNAPTDVTWTTALSGAGNLVKSGNGALTFSTPTTITPAGLAINGGSIVLDHSTNNAAKFGANAPLTLGSGTLLVQGNGAAATTDTFTGTTLTGSGRLRLVTGSNQNATANLGALTRKFGSTLNVQLVNTGTGAASAQTSTANGTTGTLGGYALVNGTDWAVASGGAIAPLAPTGYTANTWTTGTHTDITSNFTIPNAGATADVRFNTPGASTLTLTGTDSVSTGGVLVTPNVGANTTTIASGTLTAPANQEVIFQQYNTAGSLAVSSIIGNTAGTAVTQTVATLGTTTTLTVPSTAGLLPGMLITAGTNIPAASNAHIVSVNSATSLTISFSAAPTAGSAIPVTFTPGTYVTKSGPGTVVLSGANTFNGSLILNEGTVSVNTINNLGSSAATGSSSVIFNGGTLQLTGVVSSGSSIQPYIFGPGGGTIDVASVNINHNKQGNSISGSGTFTKTGPGSMSIGSNGSAFNGQVVINQGILFFQSNQFQSAQGVTVNPGGQYQINDDAVGGNFNIVAGGMMSLNGAGPVGGTTPGAFALTDQSPTGAPGGPQTNFNSAVFLAGDATVGVYNGTAQGRVSQLTFALPVSGPGSLLKTGPGILVLSNAANSYGNGAGTTVISNGSLRINGGDNRLPVGTSLQFGEAGSTNDGTFDMNGLNQTVAGLSSVGSATGHQIINGSSSGTSTLTVNYNGASPQTFAGAVGSLLSSTAINFVKSGTGSLTLSGANVYAGSTTVSGGTLRVVSNTVSRPYTVTSGAGLTVVNADPATPFAMSTLSAGTTGTSNLGFELTSGKPTTGVVSVNDFNGFTTAGNINVSLSGPLSVGQFTLVDYNGTIGGAGYGAFAGGTLSLPSRVLGTLVNNTANSSVDVNITGTDFIKWTGATDGNWNVNTTPNFKLNSTSLATTYLEAPAGGDSTVFDETAPGTHTVNLTTTLTPSSVTVSGPSDYTFSGTGSLNGAAGITKSGAGTLTILTNNTNTGTTTVSGGTLMIGNGGTTGTLGTGNLVNNGAVVFNRTDDVSFAPGISGTGSLTKNGPGTLLLTGTLAVGGNTTISAGTLAVNAGKISGNISGAGALVKSSVGTFIVSGDAAHTGGTTVSAGTLQIGDGGATGTLSGPINVAGGALLAFNRTTDSVYGGDINGGGGLLKDGAGTIKLSGAVNYTGPTTINAGAVDYSVNVDTSLPGRIGGTGGLIKSGAGTLTLLSNSTIFTGDLTVNQGTVVLADLGGSGDINSANVIINPGGKFVFGQGGVTGENPDIPDTTLVDINGGEYEIRVGEQWGAARLRNNGTYRITGAVGSTFNAISGTFTGMALESGTIIAQNTGAGSGTITLGPGVPSIDKTTPGTVTVVGKVSFAAAAPFNIQEGILSFDTTNVTTGGGNITLGTSATGGTFQMTGAGSATTSRPFNIAENAGGATAGTFDITDPNGTLTLTGSMSNSGSMSKVVKAGAGTLVMTPTNYTGSFAVNAGTLRVNAGFASGAFSVAGGANLAIVPGASPATTTVSSLAVADGGKITFELDTPTNPAVPLLAVSTPDGLTAPGAVHTLTVNNPQSLSVGQFTLIDYDGAAITSGYTLGTLPSRVTGSLLYNTANTSIDLNITSADTTLWNGNLSADWDTGTAIDVGGTKNFRLTSNAAGTNFVTGDRTTFDDTATGTTTVNLPAAVQPASVTVDNTSKNYVFQGPGFITGSSGLAKRGTGSLTITTDNTYTGQTTVSAGTLSLGSGGTTGSITGPVFVDGNGTLTFNRSNDLSYGGAITGNGIVTKSGTGTLTLLGSSQFTGTVSVDQGTMLLDDLGAGGDLFATSIVVNNGASFVFGEHGNVDFPDSTIVTVNTGGVFELRQGENFGGVNLKGGTFRMAGTTLTGINAVGAQNAGFNLESGNITTSFTGAATGGVLNGPGSINKITPGTVTVDAGVSFGATATMNILQGVLAMPASSFPNGGTTTVTLGDSSTNGTIRVLDAATGTSSRQFDIAPGGGTIDVANAAGAVSLTGLLTGSGKLTKAGPGTLSVTGAADLTGPVEVTGGSLVVTGSLANSSGVTVSGGKFDAAAAQTVKGLTVNGGQARVVSAAVKIALTVGDGSANTSQLSLTGGTLDLTTNGLAVHYAAGNDAAVLASVRAQVKSGYHPSAPNAGDGDWKGTTGITSANAAANSLGAVGYALAGDVLPFSNGTTDTFLGTTVDKNTVVARYTLAGDVNLDGSVDFLDLAKLAQSYNVTDGTRQWSTGDVNYDGNTDFLDLAKLAQSYNTALPSSPIPGAPADFQADLARAFASVPEPSMLGAVGLSLLMLRRRKA